MASKDLPDEEDIRQSIQTHILIRARQDAAFRQELIQNPKKAIGWELGVELPKDFDIKVFQETANSLYLVLPAATAKDELSDQMLEAVAGGCSKGGGGMGSKSRNGDEMLKEAQ